jgi:hypothetical protein
MDETCNLTARAYALCERENSTLKADNEFLCDLLREASDGLKAWRAAYCLKNDPVELDLIVRIDTALRNVASEAAING